MSHTAPHAEYITPALAGQGESLAATKYFTTIVTSPADKNRRQAAYLEALGTLPDFHIYYGHYLADTITCRSCGHAYTTHHEKMTDVNIAIELLSDAFEDRCDVALLISADSDLVGPVERVRRLFPQKQVVAVFPPARYSNALKNVVATLLHLGRVSRLHYLRSRRVRVGLVSVNPNFAESQPHNRLCLPEEIVPSYKRRPLF